MWLTTAKASGQGASSQVKVTATLRAFVELSKFGWKRILGDRSSDLNIHKHCFRSTCTAVFCPCTALFCPLEEVFLSSTEGNRFLIIPSWNAGKTFLLQLYRTRRWINQIYSTPLVSKLLPAVYLELTSSLTWSWRLTWWWSNIFQDMVPTVQPIFFK